MLELWHHGSSVCAAKVRFTLAEKGLDWKGHYVDILKGSIALYSTVRRLSEEDAAVVHDLAPHALDRLVDKYR